MSNRIVINGKDVTCWSELELVKDSEENTNE